MAQIMPKYHLACRRGGAFCKSIVSTARRGGVPFVRTKGTKIRSRGTASPLTNPFLSLAVLDTNDAEASSVQRRRYALKVPAAHFILDSAETELK